MQIRGPRDELSLRSHLLIISSVSSQILHLLNQFSESISLGSKPGSHFAWSWWPRRTCRVMQKGRRTGRGLPSVVSPQGAPRARLPGHLSPLEVALSQQGCSVLQCSRSPPTAPPSVNAAETDPSLTEPGPAHGTSRSKHSQGSLRVRAGHGGSWLLFQAVQAALLPRRPPR